MDGTDDAQPQLESAGVTATAASSAATPDSSDGSVNTRNLDVLLDIPMEVSVQLGSTRMQIRELLQLGQGSVIELEKMAGEPLEVLVNQRLVARGEVVVVNEKFGIRLTDVISPAERIQKLR